MSYHIKFNPENKAVRRDDNVHLGLETHNGLIDVYILRKSIHVDDMLVAIPLTENNGHVLGVADSPKFRGLMDSGEQWMVPPFKLQRQFLRQGGPFRRLGKLSEDSYDFDVEKTATLWRVTEAYNPYIRYFVPREHALDPDFDPANRDGLEVYIHVSKIAYRPATEQELGYHIIPGGLFGLGHPDLWLEQFKCWCLDLPIPTKVRGEHD